MWHRQVNPSTWVVCLQRGERVCQSLHDLSARMDWCGAEVSGIGGLSGVTLGFWEKDRGDYSQRSWEGPFELLSLLGNLSRYQGRAFAHLHASLAGPDFAVLGGHFIEGTVTATAEIFVRPCQTLDRQWNAEIGAGLWTPQGF